MARVNIVKQIKVGDRWVLKAIPRKENGERDWKALPEGSYFVEWRTNGKRKREPAGLTVSEALEARRIKKAELAATAVGILQRYKPVAPAGPEPQFLSSLIRRYLDQIDTLKKPNTYRKYNAVLTRFEEQFPNRRLEQISIEELNDFVVKLRKSGLSANNHKRATSVIGFLLLRVPICARIELPTRKTSLARGQGTSSRFHPRRRRAKCFVSCGPTLLDDVASEFVPVCRSAKEAVWWVTFREQSLVNSRERRRSTSVCIISRHGSQRRSPTSFVSRSSRWSSEHFRQVSFVTSAMARSGWANVPGTA
jgi:hypothetical protein